MPAVRQKSIQLTAYLEHLLLKACPQQESGPKLFSIITPSNQMWRGAQLSVLLRGDILDGVFSRLLDSGIVVDERKPNVIRVAPAPLYNTFVDVWNFVQIFVKACEETERQAAEQGK